MKFSISQTVLEKFPEVVEYIVIARGLNNEIPGKWISDEMKKVKETIQEKGPEYLNEKRFSRWTEAYAKVAESAGLETAGFMPSHVALAKRVLAGKDLPNISPIVNFYNLFSVKYGIPFGGEDLSAVYGDAVLDFASGKNENELFVGIGADNVVSASHGEIVWRDDHSVTCRMWGWRQSERTKITRESRDIYFVIDGFSDLEVNLDEVVREFVKGLEEHFGAKCVVGILNKQNPVFKVEYETKSISGLDVWADLQKLAERNKKSKDGAQKKSFMKRRSQSLGLVDRMHLTSRIEAAVDAVLASAGYSEGARLNISLDPKFGDYSTTIALRLAKELKKKPNEIAGHVVELLSKNGSLQGFFDGISAAPNGFVNFKLSESFLMSELQSSLEKGADFGRSAVGTGCTILVESPSINPNAPAHAGHLMNLFLARALARLVARAGFKVEIDNAIHDKGLKIYQLMWGVEHLSGGKTPETEGLKEDHFIGKYYWLAKQKFLEDENVQNEVRQMQRDWEAGDPEIRKLWKKCVDWAYKGHSKTFERLGEVEGFKWYESDMYRDAKAVIERYIGGGVIVKLPDGAVVARLEQKYGIPDVIMIRSDGTSLYTTQDIQLTQLKVRKFKPWKAVWVVGSEQIAHFQSIFAILDELKIMPIDNLYHFAYGLVVDKSGEKIGKGHEAAIADNMLNIMHREALKIMEQRKVDVALEDREAVAEAVGLGALRYSFLAHDPMKDVVFDPGSALSFTGRSGPYIMYAYSRGKSVLRKVNEEVSNYGADAGLVDGSHSAALSLIDRELIMKMVIYPEIVLESANKYAPNVLADYLYEIANLFSNFYEKETIAGAKGDERKLRVAITELFTRIVKDGLGILGINALEKM